MSMESGKLKAIVCEKIDSKATELNDVSKEIWKNPELNFKEVFAHDILTQFLIKEGFNVEKSYKLDTAFKACFGSGNGPHVAVICEYDALPEIGHACGHNLIAEVGIAVGIALKAAIESADIGKVTVLGTPAEEGGAGKVMMIDLKVFDGYDFAMMAHPSPRNVTRCICLGKTSVKVRYHGKSAHAAGYPWKGINALDAAVMCYNSISCMRQQLEPTWRVHGIITNGGVKPNIIPELSEVYFYLRTPTEPELQQLKKKALTCFEGAATSTGCTVEIEWDERPYSNLITNDTMAKLYESNATSLGIQFLTDEKARTPLGSTDMGNVSHIVPSIHPEFYIGTAAVNHSHDFTKASGAPEAQPYTIKQAKALAMTAIDIMTNPDALRHIKEDFLKDLRDEQMLNDSYNE